MVIKLSPMVTRLDQKVTRSDQEVTCLSLVIVSLEIQGGLLSGAERVYSGLPLGPFMEDCSLARVAVMQLAHEFFCTFIYDLSFLVDVLS
ncbi:unnamed protein product [Prunus armeniaca]|uniref:Uncharacterized protein n=1 Tax=Prunus armeniaca TaxID=36596 RepID=A0A6J5VJX4_PRUAR|nr:unnamed protein product [Prunus armeniaca]